MVTEGSADMGGMPFSSLSILGYDASKEAFVGTYVDSLQTQMWNASGQLDEAQRVLRMEAEGPSYDDPGKTTSFREEVELMGEGKRRTTSFMLGADGTWSVYMTVTAQRIEGGGR